MTRLLPITQFLPHSRVSFSVGLTAPLFCCFVFEMEAHCINRMMMMMMTLYWRAKLRT